MLRRCLNRAGSTWLADKKILPACYGNLSKDSLPDRYSAILRLNCQSDAYESLTTREQ